MRPAFFLLFQAVALAQTTLPLHFPGAVARTRVYEESGRLRLPGLYPGIDAVFYRNHGSAEYDFIVAPHADPSRIRIAFDGADSVRLTGAGNIEIRHGVAVVEQERPYAYQRVAGMNRSVPCRYQLDADGEIRLELGAYDRDSVLVIDPVLISQFLIGGPNGVTGATGIASDSAGYTYLVGTTSWAGFPTTPGPLSKYNGSRGYTNLTGDVFVMKLAPQSNAVIWAVLVGGSGDETSAGIAVDAQGNVYVSGYTDSPDFPVTSPPSNGHKPAEQDPDLFVFKLNPQGTALVYSTLIGGSGYETATGLALAADQHVVLVGNTRSADFPVTANAVQPSLAVSDGSLIGSGSAVVVRLNSAGAVDYATYLGGPGGASATGVAVDQTGDIYVTGYAGDFFPTLASSFAPLATYGGFVTRINHTTGQFAYSTYIPGGEGLAIIVDGDQNAYVAGSAAGIFPATPGAFQTDGKNSAGGAFVLELNSVGTALIFATLIGGSASDRAVSLALSGNSVIIAGITDSPDFPATDHSMPACNTNSVPTAYYYQPYSVFVASFDHTGKLLVSSEYGECQDLRVSAIAESAQGLLLAGTSILMEDSFLFTLDLSAQNQVQIAYVLDAASLQIGTFAPLEVLTILGQGLGPKQGVPGSSASGHFPTSLAGTQVSFGGTPAPLLYVSDTQINTVVPGNASGGSFALQVTSASGISAPFQTWTQTVNPAIFTVTQSGIGQGAILNQDGTINSASNPAARGSIISIFGTGGGQITPAYGDGQLVPTAAPLVLERGVAVYIYGLSAPVSYAGAAPSLVNGVVQINAQIPLDASTGSAVPIYFAMDPYWSQYGITVAVK